MALIDTGGKKPSTPTIGTASHSGSVLTISVPFTAPTYTGKGTISSYTVTSTGGHTASGASSTISVGGLTAGTLYTFTVRATTNTGVTSDSSSASNAVTALTTPANVTGLSISRPASGQITVSWTAVSADAAGRGGAASVTYSVYYGTTSSPATLYTTTASTSTTISLTAGTSYWFKVVTNNSLFSSAGTTTATSTLCLATPANVTGLTTSRPSSTAITVSWTAVSADAAGRGGAYSVTYDVYYGTTSNPTTLGWFETSGTSITGYFTAGTTYWFKVITKNSSFSSAGTTTASGTLCLATPANATNVAITRVNGTSDSANQTVSNTGRFTVTWTAASGGGETPSYDVYLWDDIKSNNILDNYKRNECHCYWTNNRDIVLGKGNYKKYFIFCLWASFFNQCHPSHATKPNYYWI